MIVANLKFTTDLDRGVRMTMLRNALFVGDQDAHRFIVSCFRSTSRQPVDLTGAGVTGYFIRADQSTVVIDGKVEDNCAVLTLPAACYAKQGRFSLVIKASMSGVIHTILWAEGAVSVSHTGTIIDPGEVVPTLDELLAQIEAMQIATNNANQAAQDAVTTANAAAQAAQKTAADAATAAQKTAADAAQEAKATADAAAARADKATGELQGFADAITAQQLLQYDTIPNTTQQYTYDASGTLTAIRHMQNGAPVRTDAFAFGDA